MWKYLNLGNDEVFQVLEKRNLKGIAQYMQSDTCKHVFVMTGAGISTAAGIPDFRSPETGLYANLSRLKLPYPEAVFDIRFFRENPLPFYVLAHELAPGRFRPTLTHSFIRLLAEKSLLDICFTQNIDTLERRAGVPAEKLVEAHGSFATQHCIECQAFYPDDEMKQAIKTQNIPHCKREGCDGLVKPDIVFFGEALPDSFHNSITRLRNADLLICMGTSLTVHPFASLTGYVPQDCPRLLINLDHVGDWGSRVNDVAVLKKCDEAVGELCRELGWEDELQKLWEGTALSVDETEAATAATPNKNLTEEEALTAEVGKLMEQLNDHLKIVGERQELLRDGLNEEKKTGSSGDTQVTAPEPKETEVGGDEKTDEVSEDTKTDEDPTNTPSTGKL